MSSQIGFLVYVHEGTVVPFVVDNSLLARAIRFMGRAARIRRLARFGVPDLPVLGRLVSVDDGTANVRLNPTRFAI